MPEWGEKCIPPPDSSWNQFNPQTGKEVGNRNHCSCYIGEARPTNFSINSKNNYTVGKYILPSHKKGEQNCHKKSTIANTLEEKWELPAKIMLDQETKYKKK